MDYLTEVCRCRCSECWNDIASISTTCQTEPKGPYLSLQGTFETATLLKDAENVCACEEIEMPLSSGEEICHHHSHVTPLYYPYILVSLATRSDIHSASVALGGCPPHPVVSTSGCRWSPSGLRLRFSHHSHPQLASRDRLWSTTGRKTGFFPSLLSGEAPG